MSLLGCNAGSLEAEAIRRRLLQPAREREVHGVVTRDRKAKLGLQAAAEAFAAFRQIPRGAAAKKAKG